MKITLTTTIRPVGFDYARALKKFGCLHLLISGFPGFVACRDRSLDEVPIHYCGGLQAIFLVAHRLVGLNFATRWLAFVAKWYLDCVTARKLGAESVVIFFSGAGLETVLAARRQNVLSVCQVHHSHVLEFEAILQREAQICGAPYAPTYGREDVRRQLAEYAGCDLILCPSEAVRSSFAKRGIPTGKLLVVAHGVAIANDLPQRPERIPGGLRVLYVGQMHYRKGLRYLLTALSQMRDPGVEGHFVGPDFGLSGVRWAEYSCTVKRHGTLKGVELLRAYVAADVFVLPSLEEGFGLVVLEAMRAGLPVVISSEVGAGDFVQDGIDGFIVPPGDSAAIEHKLVWLRDHPEYRAEMGRAAQAKAMTTGGWSDSAARLIEELEHRLEGSRAFKSERIDHG